MMISKVNELLGQKVGSNVSFRANSQSESSPVTAPEMQSNNRGLEALAAYNASLLNKEPFDMYKLKAVPAAVRYNVENINDIEGEKVYASDGALRAVISKDEDITTTYYPDLGNKEKVKLITVENKLTGKEVYSQVYSKNENGEDVVSVKEVVGNNTNNTDYVNGELVYTSNVHKIDESTEKLISFDNQEKAYDVTISKKTPNGIDYYGATLDADKQITSFEEEKNVTLGTVRSNVRFYNGMPISYEYSRTMTIPNTAGRDKINNPDLTPAQKQEKIAGLKDIDGEKTYYSNGAIESNKFKSNEGEVTAKFDIDGSLTELVADKKAVYFDGDVQSIEEKLSDGKTKVTTIYADNYKKVRVDDGNEYKQLYYSDTNKPKSYYEGEINENGDEQDHLSMYFNKEGMLESCYNW